MHRHIFGHRERADDLEHQRDRSKALQRLVEAGLGRRHVDVLETGYGQQRVAVRRRILHVGRGDPAARAGLVVDHHPLPEAARHGVGIDARVDVLATAGAEPDHESDRPLREVLRFAGRRRSKQNRGERRRHSTDPSGFYRHGSPRIYAVVVALLAPGSSHLRKCAKVRVSATLVTASL